MNRRNFFGMLVGLAGAGAVKKWLPRKPDSYIRWYPEGWFLYESKYAFRPQKIQEIILHKRKS